MSEALSTTKLPEAAYAALDALKAQAGAAMMMLPGKGKAEGRTALAVAQAQMAEHEVWTRKIVRALLSGKGQTTIETADAEWLERTFKTGLSVERVMPLSDRVRPNVEAAPWVIEEIKRLESELALAGEQAVKPETETAESDSYAAVAAIQFALNDDEGLLFLRHWNQGDFDVIRREWPEAPEEVFIGADPLLKLAK